MDHAGHFRSNGRTTQVNGAEAGYNSQALCLCDFGEQRIMPEETRDSASPTISGEISLSFGAIALNATVRVPAGQTTLTELLPIIRNLENAIVERVGEEAESAGRQISCRAGCGACCRQMVPVSLFEAEALTKWIGTLAPEQRAELERRFHHALSTLRDAGVIEKILNNEWVLDGERTTQLAIDYFHAGVACPFLENESCSIHPIRPLSCREYLVTSPPELCRDPAVNEVAGIRLPVKLSRALYTFGQRMEQDPRGWIPMVFLLAWGKSGARPGEYVAGSGPEVLGRFLEEVKGISKTAPEESKG
jgi:Fe-S-cluster containining protein